MESILRRNLPWASAVSVKAFASGPKESVICAIGEGALSAEKHILVQVADVSDRSSRAIPSENGRSVESALMSLVSSSSHSLSGNNMGSVLFQASGGRPCRGASRTCSSGWLISSITIFSGLRGRAGHFLAPLPDKAIHNTPPFQDDACNLTAPQLPPIAAIKIGTPASVARSASPAVL